MARANKTTLLGRLRSKDRTAAKRLARLLAELDEAAAKARPAGRRVHRASLGGAR